MSRSAKLLRNIAANWVGFAVNAAVTLVLTPFVLHTLGEARYGVWVISSSIIGYYGLLDLGFRGSINQYLTRYLAIPDYERASATISTAVVALTTLGIAFAVLSIGTAYLAPRIWNVPPDMEQEAFWCILIVGLTSALQFVFFPYMSVFVATQRFDLANLIGIGTRLLTALCVFVVLSKGLGLIGISAATCAVALLDYVVRWRVARTLAPDLRIERSRASLSQLRELASFGVWTFLIAINGYVYLHAQPLIIGVMLPIAAVGYYALATGLLQQINGALSPIGQVMYPAATALHAQSDRATLERLYHDGSRLMMLVMGCVVVIGFVWAEDFYRIWIGAKYVAPGGAFTSVALLLQVLLLSTVTSFFANIAGQILMGSGRVPLLATLLICGSALNLTLSFILIGPFGLLGLAMATVIASLIIDLIAVPFALQWTVGLRVLAMMRASCPRPLLVSVLLAGSCTAIHAASPRPSGPPELLLHGVVAGMLAALLVLGLGVTADERRRFLWAPLQRFVARRRAGMGVRS